MKIENVKLSQVKSVYSGKPGRCCCGCSGNHRYASVHRLEAGKSRGYAIDATEINDRQVKRVFNLVTRNPDLVEYKGQYDDDFLSAVIDSRLYILYFSKTK